MSSVSLEFYRSVASSRSRDPAPSPKILEEGVDRRILLLITGLDWLKLL